MDKFEIARKIKERRISSGISQQVLADLTGSHIQSIGKYESMNENNTVLSMSIEKLYVIAKRLGVSSDWLLGLTDSRILPDDNSMLNSRFGMSEKAIENLSIATKHCDLLSAFIENEYFLDFCRSVEILYNMAMRLYDDSPEHEGFHQLALKGQSGYCKDDLESLLINMLQNKIREVHDEKK